MPQQSSDFALRVPSHEAAAAGLSRRLPKLRNPVAPSFMPQGILIEKPAQSDVPIELPPRSFGLRKTIGDRIDCGGIYAKPNMACFDLDVLGRRGFALDTAPPRDDTVCAAENRCRRNRWRRGKSLIPYAVDLLAACELIDTPCIRRSTCSPLASS
jgi:hypothetical protein